MRYRVQYFKYLWRHNCLSFTVHHGESCTKWSTCSNKIKMPKSTAGCRIKSFISIEHMNVNKFRATKINPNKFTQIYFKWIQKSDFFFLIGIHSMQGWTATTWHGVTRKGNTKRLRQKGNLFRKNLQLKNVF